MPGRKTIVRSYPEFVHKYTRSGLAVSALLDDLDNQEETIFDRLFSEHSQDPWLVHWATRPKSSHTRFDCTSPELEWIPEGTAFQSYPDPATNMKCFLYTKRPGEPESKRKRALHRGEIVWSAGPAERHVTGYGRFVCVPIDDA